MRSPARARGLPFRVEPASEWGRKGGRGTQEEEEKREGQRHRGFLRVQTQIVVIICVHPWFSGWGSAHCSDRLCRATGPSLAIHIPLGTSCHRHVLRAQCGYKYNRVQMVRNKLKLISCILSHGKALYGEGDNGLRPSSFSQPTCGVQIVGMGLVNAFGLPHMGTDSMTSPA
jgi:hypothetical protein